MNKNYKKYFIYYLFGIILFSACEEAALPMNSDVTNIPLTDGGHIMPVG